MSNLSASNRERGIEVLHDPTLNKSTSYTGAEREAPGIVGLVPDLTESIETQLDRALLQLKDEATGLDRFIYLINVLDLQENTFLSNLMSDPARFLGIVLRPDHRGGVHEVRPHLTPPARNVSVDYA